MAIKSIAEKASIYMRIGQAICEMVDASTILAKPKRKPRVTKKVRKAKKVEKPAVKKAPRVRQEEPDDDDNE